MKKLLLLLLCVPLIGLGQNRYHIDEVTSPNDTLTYLKHDMSLLNGIVYSEFGDLGMYVYGKEEGLHKRWFEDGQLWTESNYKEGEKEGLHKRWYENGQLGYEGYISDGNWWMSMKSYYENGQLKRYSKDGLVKLYDENGDITSEGYIEPGEHGKEIYQKTYYPDKTLLQHKQFDYADGKKNVLWKQWYQNGQLSMEGYWKDIPVIDFDLYKIHSFTEGNGFKDGLHRWWRYNGQLQRKTNYNYGELISDECWDEEGKKIDCE